MKNLILTLIATASITSFGAPSNHWFWHTEGLAPQELEEIDYAEEHELKAITECMRDQNEHAVANSSCINEVFGDVI